MTPNLFSVNFKSFATVAHFSVITVIKQYFVCIRDLHKNKLFVQS